MNDEFTISKVIETGNNSNESTSYILFFKKQGSRVGCINHDDLVLLNEFLTEYLKKEGGSK